MWNAHSLKWRDVVFPVADWLVETGIVGRGDLPIPLRRSWWWASRAAVPLAPWAWRAMKLKKKIFGA